MKYNACGIRNTEYFESSSPFAEYISKHEHAFSTVIIGDGWTHGHCSGSLALNYYNQLRLEIRDGNIQEDAIIEFLQIDHNDEEVVRNYGLKYRLAEYQRKRVEKLMQNKPLD